MKGSRGGLGGRLAMAGVAAALVLSLAGDRTSAAMVPATIYGQDPLEVLELKVRPNVFVVLDTSGSMKWKLDYTGSTIGAPPNSGDHPRAKMYQAKQVLKQIVQNNQDRVSFLFGTYTQKPDIVMANRAAVIVSGESLTTGFRNRFQFWASSKDYPSMIGSELVVRNDTTNLGNRGLQSWQIIDPAWNTLYYAENDGAGNYLQCTAILPSTGTRKFFRDGGNSTAACPSGTSGTACTLSHAIAYAMNNPTGCSRPGGRNVYQVSYAGGAGAFTIARSAASTRSFSVRWDAAPNNIAGALGRQTASTTPPGSTVITGTPFELLYRENLAATNGTNIGAQYLGMQYKFLETIGGTSYTNYHLRAGRFFNGERIHVNGSGVICGLDFPGTAGNAPEPTPYVLVKAVGGTLGTCGAAGTQEVKFTWGGAYYTGTGTNADYCGFNARVPLVPCDLISPPAPLQVTTINPYFDNEFPLNANGSPAAYTERQDGTWGTASYPAYTQGGVKAYGSTPIAASLRQIEEIFKGTNAAVFPGGTAPTWWLSGGLWGAGQTGATEMEGPPPYAISAIKDHGSLNNTTRVRSPKEKSIVLFVTDGEDTCAPGGLDYAALTAARNGQRLYAPVACKDPDDGSPASNATCADLDNDGEFGPDMASSVQSFIIGYGGAFSGTEAPRLNWIAWGGSGLGQTALGQPAVTDNGTRWTTTDESSTTAINDALKLKRAGCTTCVDAFLAPDEATLAAQIQGLINQGAQDEEFVTAQSITESIFEYVDLVDPARYDPRAPSTRYRALVPTRILSSFSLPGFNGQLRSYQNDGTGNSVQMWNAAEKLYYQVQYGTANPPSPIPTGYCPGTGVCSCNNINGGGAGECTLPALHGGATDLTIATSGAKLKRRVYTTNRNGIFTRSGDPAGAPLGLSPQALATDASFANRLALWPPSTTTTTGCSGGVAPADYVTPGCLDGALGLPLDSAASPATELTSLQTQFKACLGLNPPTECASTNTALVRMKAARREAREILLGFMAGVQPVTTTNGLKRTNTTGSPRRLLLFKARSWMMGDATLATPAVVTPPLAATPSVYQAEYKLLLDGPRDNANKNPENPPVTSTTSQIRMGLGLRNPDNDGVAGADTARPGLKPVMTVVYAPGNDMLHAFRAGPQCNLSVETCVGLDRGGEELWGFVPYDQLEALRLRVVNDPQTRDNHVYMMARGVRFADVFVPGTFSTTVSGVTVSSVNGMWRRVLYVPRGIGGKHLTAIDVTAPGPYTQSALVAAGPIPLWSRGNPDTLDGRTGGTASNNATDRTAYAKMGETWSIPVVAFIDSTGAVYSTPRRAAGTIDQVLFMGSGYGAVGEGTTFFTLDALTGDAIATADVETAAGSFGLGRTLPYRNALVANAVGFNPKIFSLLKTVHPADSTVTRVYIGDVHGRVWKFLTARPDVALPVADLGAEQPVGTAASLLGLPPQPETSVPYVFLASGNDNRQDGPFRVFAFRDDGDDTNTAVGAGQTAGGVTTFLPAVQLYDREFDQGQTASPCGYGAEAVFRGTVQPAATFECTSVDQGVCQEPLGRVLFGGTRLSLPNTKYAPPTPLACGEGVYPCRSVFDSIVYLLGAETGQAAYDLNAAGDDAYRIFRDTRIAAITTASDPDPTTGGGSVALDKGKKKGDEPDPPPKRGVPPTGSTSTANVVMKREPGQPPPAIRYGSTVCQ